MADNYLENRMADYRSGRISASSQAGRSTRSALEKISPSVFVIGGETESGQRMIRHFRSLGWRVAFTHPVLAEGRALAQSAGAQHHPIDPSESKALGRSIHLIVDRWGHLDLIVNCLGAAIPYDGDIPVLRY